MADKLLDSHLREELISRQEILKGTFLYALRDTISLPDGQAATREYVVHPGAVMVVPLIEEPGQPLRVVLERQFGIRFKE